jgi:hypothetical protein
MLGIVRQMHLGVTHKIQGIFDVNDRDTDLEFVEKQSNLLFNGESLPRDKRDWRCCEQLLAKLEDHVLAEARQLIVANIVVLVNEIISDL